MLQRGGRLREDAGMYERRDRAKIGLGKGKFLSQPGGMVIEEELEVEERMSAGMGVDVNCGWYFAFFSRVLR